MSSDKKKFILAIDQGTTNSRIIIYNNKFSVIDSIQKEFSQFFPQNGWVEHNAIEIWNDVKLLISKILTKNKIKASQIFSIGITNQRETTVLWNKKTGKPIYNAIVWQDRRTTDICDSLKKKKLERKIQKITGLLIDPYFSATKIKWILDNNTETKKLIKEKNLLFGTIDTWLLWNLTEKRSHITDITNASRTMLYDSKKEEWSTELLKIIGIPKSILPEVVANAYSFGITNLFGAPIPIGGMAGDQQAATIGQACFKNGQSKSTYGTGCFLLMNIGKKFYLSKNKLVTTVAYKIGNQKMYCFEGSIFVAGSAIQWLRDKLYFFKDPKETSLLYSKANINENIMVVPALTGLGSPYWEPNVRGGIFGLTRNTSIAEIVKATLDSLAYQTLDLIEVMQKDSGTKITEMRVDGGMTVNNEFVQSLSNILQIKIVKPNNIETTALGVAYLAALSSGLIKDIDSITKLWKSKNVYKVGNCYYPKIKGSLIKKQILIWKKTVSLLIKYHS
jgi:glycerol kinase